MTIQYKISIIIIALIATSFAHGQDTLPSVCAESIETYGVSGFDDSEFYWEVTDKNYNKTFEWVISGNGTDTVKIHWGYNTGRYKLAVREVTPHNCEDISVSEVVIKAPYVDFGYDYQEVCENDSLLIEPYIQYDDDYRIEWFNGDIDIPYYYAKNTETVWVYVLADDGCYRYDTIEITQNELPVVDLGSDEMVCAIEGGYQIDLGNIGVDYLWTSTLHDNGNDYAYSNSQYQDIIPSTQEFDTITVTVTDINNCSNSDTVVILPCNIDKIFENMANTITPDGDDINDIWEIEYIEYFPDAVLEIFDRQGRMVYRTEDPLGNPWDGKSKGRAMPMDSYYFVLDLNFMDAKPIVGNINIVK